MAHTTTHRGKKPYKYSHLLGFLDVLLDVGPTTSSLPIRSQDSDAPETRRQQPSNVRPNSQRSRESRQSVTEEMGSDFTDEAQPNVRPARHQTREQGTSPPPLQEQTRSLSPCSRVDQAVLGYLRGQQGADWAELYCASLVPSFRALPPHMVPKMKVAVETLFDSTLGSTPTEECFWLLAQWSLHGRGRFPNRAEFSIPPPAQPVSHEDTRPDPVSDFFSPFLDNLLQEHSEPGRPVASTSDVPLSNVPVLPAAENSEILPQQLDAPANPGTNDQSVVSALHTQLPISNAGKRTPELSETVPHIAMVQKVKCLRKKASKKPPARYGRSEWQTTSSGNDTSGPIVYEPKLRAKETYAPKPVPTAGAGGTLPSQSIVPLSAALSEQPGCSRDVHQFFRRQRNYSRGGKGLVFFSQKI
ncbi:uncharacterized protein [Eleutherodactylus coqui]|uniref:uncharacterized protein n=1 Tax=Eleutherodactylus coqui TaxID=57060 RepID=UPI003461C336